MTLEKFCCTVLKPWPTTTVLSLTTTEFLYLSWPGHREEMQSENMEGSIELADAQRELSRSTERGPSSCEPVVVTKENLRKGDN